MINQLMMAKTAMVTLQHKMQIISNNVANAQTVGYKSRRMELETMFPAAFERAITEFDDASGTLRKRRKVFEYGQGVRISDISKNFQQGTIEITNQPLDMAVKGNGLFQFRLPDGKTAYSRAGNLHSDREGNLVSANGHTLEPAMKMPRGTTDVIVNEEGRVFVMVGEETQPREIGQMILANFQNVAGLREIGQNMYIESEASGEPLLERPGKNGVGSIQHKALEFSNVNVIDEMVAMVMVQRVFEIAVKAVNAADAIMKKGGGI
jgi:flagellar basal-body rod protein FlgG